MSMGSDSEDVAAFCSRLYAQQMRQGRDAADGGAIVLVHEGPADSGWFDEDDTDVGDGIQAWFLPEGGWVKAVGRCSKVFLVSAMISHVFVEVIHSGCAYRMEA